MKIQAKIKVINAPVEGVSQSNGKVWKRQDVILGWDEQYAIETNPAQHGNSMGDEMRTREQLLLVTLHGQQVATFAERGYKVGDVIAGDLDFGTRAYGGRVFNDIRMYV